MRDRKIKGNEFRYPFYDHPFPLVRFYWHKVISTIVSQLEVVCDLILDFGCGKQRLKQYLLNYNIIGYDIDNTLSDKRLYYTKAAYHYLFSCFRAHGFATTSTDLGVF